MAHGHKHHQSSPHIAPGDAPLDAANQSLADALRASFNILKFIMFVLVVMYCLSGIQCIDEHEQAVVLRFGKLMPDVRDPGLSKAFPYPIDDTLRFPAKKSNKFMCMDHWPHVKKDQQAESLGKIKGAGGLNPTIDGSLLTADRGMVHIQWDITYRVNDLRNYILNVADSKTEKTETLLSDLLDWAAISVISKYSAEEVTRGKTADIAMEVKSKLNESLEELGTGLVVVALDIPRSSVPGQTISAFDAVTRAENIKQKEIRTAEQRRTDILNEAAGPAYEELIALLDEHDAAEAAGNEETLLQVRANIDNLLDNKVAGAAGRAIKNARGFYTQVVQQVKGEVEEYHASLDEFLNARELFLHRMWEKTRQQVLTYDGVKKHMISPMADEIRIKIGPDPEQRRIDERKKLQKEAEEHEFELPGKVHMVP